ncbi:MAG: nickel-dependent lactate racemase [Candidatus Bathyarchaeia archaeon]
MVKIPYGEGHLEAELPAGNRVSIFRPSPPRDPIGMGSIERTIREAVLRNRASIRASKGRICLLVSDNTRAAFNGIIVPRLLGSIGELVDTSELKILVANGLHRPMSDRELEEELGKDIVERFEVLNHIADDEDRHMAVGRTRRGTEVLLDREYLGAELRIATGLVEPHFFAGFSGGYKSVLPGISASKTIYQNHCFEMVGHPNARAGILDGNPIHEDIWEAGRMSGLGFIVNVTAWGGAISRVYAGDVDEAYGKAVEEVGSRSRVRVDGLYDVVLTSNGGYPLDRNLYQAVKGISAGESIVKEGGTIIIASECRDGVAHIGFQELMEQGEGPEDVLDFIKLNQPLRDQWQAQILARALLRAKVVVVSDGVGRREVERMKMKRARDIGEALEEAGVRERSGKSIAIIPDGPYTIPMLTPS